MVGLWPALWRLGGKGSMSYPLEGRGGRTHDPPFGGLGRASTSVAAGAS